MGKHVISYSEFSHTELNSLLNWWQNKIRNPSEFLIGTLSICKDTTQNRGDLAPVRLMWSKKKKRNQNEGIIKQPFSI